MSNYPYPEVPRYFVEALGIHTAYYRMGNPNGRFIILLHGMSTSADSFRETMHELADEFLLIAPDIPGFGYSDNTVPYTMPHLIEWLAAFWEALQLPPVALVGHSFGGALAAGFALAYPQDVTRLLLVAPALLSQENYPDALKKVGISLGLVDLGSAVSQSRAMVKRQIKVPFYDPSQQHESVWERRLKDYELARASADVIKLMAFYDLRPKLNRLTHPTCLVWGENDKVVPPDDALKLTHIIPHTEVDLFPQCGHAPILEKQAEFQAVVRRFLLV